MPGATCQQFELNFTRGRKSGKVEMLGGAAFREMLSPVPVACMGFSKGEKELYIGFTSIRSHGDGLSGVRS